MKESRFPFALLLILIFCCASAEAQQKIIFDTDFARPPQDDSLALILALNSPELEILGVTTVAGNRSREQATADALRVLEIAGRSAIPVYEGANMPLLHEKSEYAMQRHGTWWSDEPPPEPPGGFARRKPERESAFEFMRQTVAGNPGQVTIVAIGPLTNVAMVIRQEPDFAKQVKALYIMGGAIALLPDGAGNHTPNAEFNIWVDPEAAKIVFRSGIPIELSPLNVSRKTSFAKEFFEQIIAVDTPLTRLLKETMSQSYQVERNFPRLMYDQVAVASLIDPTLVETAELFVDVDTHHGINYGTTVGGRGVWPGAEGAQKMRVQYDLDWERFIRMFIERVTRPVPTK